MGAVSALDIRVNFCRERRFCGVGKVDGNGMMRAAVLKVTSLSARHVGDCSEIEQEVEERDLMDFRQNPRVR